MLPDALFGVQIMGSSHAARLSLAKLASKNQSVAQRSQASAAVGLLLEPASEPGATRPSPPATPIGSPCAPLNSQPAVLSSKCQFPLLTLLDAPDFTRLATGNRESGPALPPGSGGSRGDAKHHPFPSPSGWRVEGKNVVANKAIGNTFLV